jgi:hypothetical protein
MPVGDITVTAAQVAPIDPHYAEIYSFIAASTVTAGMPVYLTTSGTVAAADANAGGLQQVRGIALNGGGAGQAIDVLKQGRVAGFTLSAVDCSAPLFLSDTVGRINDGVGTMTVPVGIVVPLSDADKTRVLYAECRWGPNWA